MKRGILIFALFCSLAFAFRDKLTDEQNSLLDDYSSAIEKLTVIIPTLDNGGAEALDNLKMLRRIMELLSKQFDNEDFPELPFNPKANLAEAIDKVDQLIEAREILLAHNQQEEEEEESSSVVLNPCTAGACCNVSAGVVFAAGTGCNISDPCKEPAALCDGLVAECATSDKPDGSICAEGMVCAKGVCQRSKESIQAEQEAALIAEKEAELLKKKAIHRMLKVRRKQAAKKLKERETEKMLKRFAVMSWMNKKADSWEADITAGDYVSKLPKAPTHKDIFQHHYLGNNEAFFHSAGGIPETETADDSSEVVSSTTTTSSTTSTTANLTSTVSSAATSTVGFVLIGIGLILIVAYFVFGGKKKPQPQAIY